MGPKLTLLDVTECSFLGVGWGDLVVFADVPFLQFWRCDDATSASELCTECLCLSGTGVHIRISYIAYTDTQKR